MTTRLNKTLCASRREFMVSAAATLGSAVLPNPGVAAPTSAKWRRWNLSDPKTPADVRERVLASYKKAIREMLKRPPQDQLNWYRNALTHTLDCPHGNWWFLAWHRGYLGWFERKCRELSGDPEFALPYWDWTTTTENGVPRVPDYMFDDVLDPNNEAFIGTHEKFKARFRDAIRKADYWDLEKDGTPSDRYGQLIARGIRFPDDLWFDVIDNPPSHNNGFPNMASKFFFDRPHARGLTRGNPYLDAGEPKGAPGVPICEPVVELEYVECALGPKDFETFASPKALGGHNIQVVGFGPLEHGPHNLVHNCVGGGYNGNGGFMLNFMSPVDPIFFLHHSNIDRLWEVWTRKQTALGYPTLPEGKDLTAWSNEPFLFFADEKGRPVSATAGDYAKIGAFDYDYQPGTGEKLVPAAGLAAAPPAPIERFTAEIDRPSSNATQPPGGLVKIPQDLIQAAPKPGGPKLFAKITVGFPPRGHFPLVALINAPAGAASVSPSSPHFVATLDMFGTHVMHCPVTFTVCLSRSLTALRANNLLEESKPLDIRVAPSGISHVPSITLPGIEVVSIVIEAH